MNVSKKGQNGVESSPRKVNLIKRPVSAYIVVESKVWTHFVIKLTEKVYPNKYLFGKIIQIP